MARVPTPAGRLVDRQVGGATPLAAPDVTAGGRAIAGAVERFGGEVVQAGENQDALDDQLDQAAAKKIDNEYSDWSRGRLWTGDSAFYTLEGFDAANARKGAEDDIEKKRQELLARTSSPRMRKMAEEALGRRADADLEGVGRHATGQYRIEEKKQSTARKITAANDAVLYWKDPVRFAQEIQVGESEIMAEADRSGSAPEFAVAQKAEFRSGVFSRITKGMMVRGDIEGAYQFRNEHEKDLQPQDLEDLDNALYEPMVERHADAVVDEVLGYQPEADTAPGAPAAPAGPRLPAGPQPGARLDPTLLKGLKARGLPDHIARGVAAGIFAENTALDPNVRGGYKGRAVGLGQHLGPRRAALLAKYGPNPTYDQQLDFIVWELNGGDKGGASVLAAKDEETALHSYITDFMRPKKGPETNGDLRRGRKALGRGGDPLQAGAQQAPREHDLNDALARLDAMDLPFDVKKLAKRQLIERVGMDERLSDRQSATALEEATGILDAAEASGKPITRNSQIPSATWARMRPADRLQLRGVIERNAKPAPRTTEYGTYTALSEEYAANPQAFLKRDPVTYRNALSDPDYERVLGWRRDLMGVGKDPSKAQATHSRVTGVVKQARMGRGLDPSFLRPQDKSGKQAVEARIYKFETEVLRSVELWQRANPGKEIPDSAILEIADRQLIDTKEKDGSSHFWFERSGKGGYRVSMPRKDRDRLAAIGRRELGREPTDLEISEAYFREMGEN